MVECMSNGFLGLYDPDPDDVANRLYDNTKGVDSSQVGSGARRRLLAYSTVTNSNYTGVLNPVTCLEYGEIIFFAVDNTNYPVYDK